MSKENNGHILVHEKTGHFEAGEQYKSPCSRLSGQKNSGIDLFEKAKEVKYWRRNAEEDVAVVDTIGAVCS